MLASPTDGKFVSVFYLPGSFSIIFFQILFKQTNKQNMAVITENQVCDNEDNYVLPIYF